MRAASEVRSEGGQVQSVSRAAALLACFVEMQGPLALSELARRTELNPSTAYRLLQTLCAEGLLRREQGGERYTVGPVLAALGRNAFMASGMTDSISVLRSLVDETHESASIGVRDGDEVLVLMRVESAEALRFDRPAGTRVPLHASAMGKCLLAFGAAPVADAVRQLPRLVALTPHTLTSVRTLERDLRAARKKGYCVVDEEQHLGVRSVGAPVLGRDGHAVAAVAVQGPLTRVSPDRYDTLGAAVQAAAAQLAVLHDAGMQLT